MWDSQEGRWFIRHGLGPAIVALGVAGGCDPDAPDEKNVGQDSSERLVVRSSHVVPSSTSKPSDGANSLLSTLGRRDVQRARAGSLATRLVAVRERDDFFELEVEIPAGSDGPNNSVPALVIGGTTIRRHRRFVANRLVFVIDAETYAELPHDEPILFYERLAGAPNGQGIQLASGLMTVDGGAR